MKEFPPFRLDAVNQCLWRRRDTGGDERILLAPKAFGVLAYLVEHAGRLVTEGELLDAVWPAAEVQPQVIKSQLFQIRKALGDDAKTPTFIETMPKRGYRFIGATAEVDSIVPSLSSNLPHITLVGRDQP